MTATQRRIKELEMEVRKYKREAMVKGENRAAVSGVLGIQQLKKMGLMPTHLPDNQMVAPKQSRPPTEKERLKLREQLEGGVAGDVNNQPMLESEAGKPDAMVCSGCGEKQKIKSVKYAKNNISLKKQEQWPHLNVMRKYMRRTTFDQLEFEAFVAGETRIIYSMEDQMEAMGRLQFLCRLTHWLCRCRDWGLVRSLYEAVIELVELGEEMWCSDFSHYETMVPVGGVGRSEMRPETRKEKRETELYWCKPYQKNQCMESSPHMASIKVDEPPVPVLHICARCWMRERRRADHPETECQAKK